MTKSMNQGSLHALSGAYVVDALDDAERAAFEEHLPGCPECQLEVAELREAAVTLAVDAATAPPPELRARVLADIATVRPLPPRTGAGEETVTHATAEVVPLRRPRFRWSTLAVAAAVIAILGIATVAQPWRHTPAPSNISAVDRVMTADDATHVKVRLPDGATATIFRSVKEGKAAVVTEHMPAAPNGKVYELWLQKSGQPMVPAGVMSGSGDHRQLLRGDAATADVAAISVEPEGGSKAPTTEPIATFDFSQA